MSNFRLLKLCLWIWFLFSLLSCRNLLGLRLCYVSIYEQKCGKMAGQMISDLIQDALEDPYILRLGYKPNCKLHDPSSEHLTIPPDSFEPTPVPPQQGGDHQSLNPDQEEDNITPLVKRPKPTKDNGEKTPNSLGQSTSSADRLHGTHALVVGLLCVLLTIAHPHHFVLRWWKCAYTRGNPAFPQLVLPIHDHNGPDSEPFRYSQDLIVMC